MAILWAVEMESWDYKTGHGTGEREGTEERRKEKEGEKKQRSLENDGVCGGICGMGRMRIMLMKLPSSSLSLSLCTPSFLPV